MSRFFFDTEFFENGKTIQLISIGIVSEDGEEYYAETEEAGLIAQSNEWLRDNVWPHLAHGDKVKSRGRIADEIIEFVGWKPEFWAYYADYDWVVLCQLYGTMLDLPTSWPMFCMDFKQLLVHLGDPQLDKTALIEHHALADATWLRERYNEIAGNRLIVL